MLTPGKYRAFYGERNTAMRRFGFCASTRLALIATTLSTAAIIAAMPARANNTNAIKREGAFTIAYSGSVLMRLRTNAGGYAPEQRADEVIERLRPILELPGLRSEDIRVSRDEISGEAMIFVRDLPLVTIDHALARANNTNSPILLAEEWAVQLRSVLPLVCTRQ
jgi:hypothetical protein